MVKFFLALLLLLTGLVSAAVPAPRSGLVFDNRQTNRNKVIARARAARAGVAKRQTSSSPFPTCPDYSGPTTGSVTRYAVLPNTASTSLGNVCFDNNPLTSRSQCAAMCEDFFGGCEYAKYGTDFCEGYVSYTSTFLGSPGNDAIIRNAACGDLLVSAAPGTTCCYIYAVIPP